jgi:hypothetical protein
VSGPLRTLVRDLFAWRGGLVPREIDVRVTPGDARSGPLRDGSPATPAIVDPLDVVLPLARDGAPAEALRSAALAWTVLVHGTGGYHAWLPSDPAAARAEYEAVAARHPGDALPFVAALEAVEAAGALRATADGLVLLRPRPLDDTTLLAALGRYERCVLDGDVVGGFGREVRREAHRTFDRGVGQRRWRALAAESRLRATVDPTRGPDDEDPHWDVGPAQLRPRIAEAGTAQMLIDVRSGIPGDAFPASTEPGAPLLIGPVEIGAILLGPGGYSRNAVSLALRATAVWTMLAHATGGVIARPPTTVSALSGGYASVFGLAGHDHRKTVRAALDTLARAGLLHREPAAPSGVLVRPSGPSYATLHATVLALYRWILEDDRPDEVLATVSQRAIAYRDRHVVGQWEALLRRRAVRVAVLPAVA